MAQRRLAALKAHLAPAEVSESVASGPEVPDETFTPESTPDGDGPAPGEPGLRFTRAPGAGRRGKHAARGEAGAFGRWGVTAHHVTVAALILVAMIAVAAWWVLRSVPHAETVSVTSTRSVPTAPAAAPATGASSAPVPSSEPAPASSGAASAAHAGARLVVDVAGKVRRPGIVELSAGARVIDAIKAAGGARHAVDVSDLNLARPLADGEQVVVGLDVPAVSEPDTPAAAGSTSTSGTARINLNSAGLEELETLPGVGPVTAQAILEWRSENGFFTTTDELLEVSGIGDATLADIEPHVYV